MEQNSKNGGLLPSAIALKDSLNQKPVTSSEPMMLTPLQLELLRQGEAEIDAYLDQSPRLRAFLNRLHPQSGD
ncbi:MAG TPA: hypothetical protein VFZ34_06495 [Blastocatellia bacterium]|nr:hypothetical protein [Blastocatellia bacterium]